MIPAARAEDIAGVAHIPEQVALLHGGPLRVEVGGQVVGYVTDEQAFDAARADVQARLTGVVGWNVQPAAQRAAPARCARTMQAPRRPAAARRTPPAAADG